VQWPKGKGQKDNTDVSKIQHRKPRTLLKCGVEPRWFRQIMSSCSTPDIHRITPAKIPAYATIISTDTAHALIDTIITLDKNLIDYIMKY
jgi:hypothetical protein